MVQEFKRATKLTWKKSESWWGVEVNQDWMDWQIKKRNGSIETAARRS